MSADNELTTLADFIQSKARDSFDTHLATVLAEMGNEHAHWAQDCKVSHWHNELPCDDYERALTLAIAWLKARIERGEAT